MRLLKAAARVVVGIIVGLVILFALGYVLTFGDHSVPATVEADPTLPHITIDGVTYHAETFGSPENPVVIPVAGHEMFKENPTGSIAAVRAYLAEPSR